MVKLKIARVAAAAAASAGLIASFSGVAGASSLNGNNLDGNNCSCITQQFDHHHHNKGDKKIITSTDVDQTNNVTVDNSTDQNAYTGNVTVNGGGSQVWGSDSNNNHHNKGNSTVNATSGDSMNSNSFNANVNATNTAPDVQTPWVPSGNNKGGNTLVKTDTNIDQTNNITVDNQTTQNAYTGNVTVNGGSGKGNSTVNATSGDASNYNSTSVTVNATNK